MSRSTRILALGVAAVLLVSAAGYLVFRFTQRRESDGAYPSEGAMGGGSKGDVLKMTARSDDSRPMDEKPEIIEILRAQANRGEALPSNYQEVYFSRGPEILEEVMADEERDEDWTIEISTAATKILKQEQYKGTEFVEAECTQSLCRMVLIHADREALDLFIETGATEAPWAADQIGVEKTLSGGAIETTVYFSDPEGEPVEFEKMREKVRNEVEFASIGAP